jgi:hypothetical protein
MSSLDASYSKTNTPNGAFVSFPAGVFRAFCRSPLFTNKFEGVVFEHVFPIIIEPSFFEDATTACAREPTRETLEEEDLETFVCNSVFQKEERRGIALRKKERKKERFVVWTPKHLRRLSDDKVHRILLKRRVNEEEPKRHRFRKAG